MTPRRTVLAALAILVLALVAGCGRSPSRAPSTHGDPVALARSDASAFLGHYVDADGRVVRHDQGGDTVSEGQGYALLLADAVRDGGRFAAVWAWTRTHLQRPDGLFAYHWAGGHVVGSDAAADADVQIAWALDLAASRFGVAAYRTAARRVAEAVAEHEIGYDDQGHPLLAAGPWAIGPGKPATAEPGYWTYPADTALAALTGDHRWQALAASDEQHLAALTDGGRTLPSDWVTLGGGTAPHPVPAPDGSPVASGQDGLRALVWQRCENAGTAIGARWWRLVAPTASTAPQSRHLDGSPDDTDRSALSAVAAAAAAQAAGDQGQVAALLDQADAINATYPTYYGAAWAALGRILLTTNQLASC